ncbi:MAG: fibronectin type III domain-containing protein [Candidatus Bathyarchaeia archaeon]
MKVKEIESYVGMKKHLFGLILFSFFSFLFSFSWLEATDFTSSSFRVRDPVFHIASSTEMSSPSFRLIGTVSQIAIGTSTSASFEVRGGFLYFPKATKPVVTATAGDGKVSLSWTASQGFLGWNVSGYNVGRAAVSGGPYTFTSSLGNVLSTTITGLTNGTTYYFVVRAEDAFQNSIATSSEVSATPVAVPPAPSPGGGGIIESLLRIFGIEVPIPPEFVTLPPQPCLPATDLNCDGKIDLQDLSIFLFLTQRPMPNAADFNKDAEVDVKDLSVLLTDWTERLVTFAPENGVVPVEPRRFEKPPEKGFAALVPIIPPKELPPERSKPEVAPTPYNQIVLIFIGVIAFLSIIWRIVSRLILK